jgi:hypothetical protein
LAQGLELVNVGLLDIDDEAASRVSLRRPRGVPNKFTGELKEAILAGVNGSNKQGVAGFVLDLCLNTPTSAAALLGRLIPVSTGGTLDAILTVRHVDETAD